MQTSQDPTGVGMLRLLSEDGFGWQGGYRRFDALRTPGDETRVTLLKTHNWHKESLPFSVLIFILCLRGFHNWPKVAAVLTS